MIFSTMVPKMYSTCMQALFGVLHGICCEYHSGGTITSTARVRQLVPQLTLQVVTPRSLQKFSRMYNHEKVSDTMFCVVMVTRSVAVVLSYPRNTGFFKTTT
jgi:hypothetical protein